MFTTKVLPIKKARQRQIELRKTLPDEGEPVQNLFQRKYKEELEADSQVNSIFQMYLDHQQEGLPDQNQITHQVNSLLSQNNALADSSCLLLHNHVLLLSSSPVVTSFSLGPTGQLSMLRNCLSTFVYKYFSSDSLLDVPLESMLSLYEIYRQPSQPSFYLDLKDTMICFTYRNQRKIVLINTYSQSFLRFLKSTGVNSSLLQHLNKENLDLSENYSRLSDDATEKIQAQGSSNLLVIKENNADLFFNCLFNWILNENQEFSLYSLSEFANSHKTRPRVTQLLSTNCSSMNKTQAAFYEKLFGLPRQDFTIKSLITSKHILGASDQEMEVEPKGEPSKLYQVSLQGVFFKEQLMDVLKDLEEKGVKSFYEMNALAMTRCFHMDSIEQLYLHKHEFPL